MKKDRPVVDLKVFQLYTFSGVDEMMRKPCPFINWCFGYMFFYRDYPFWFVRRTGRSGSVEFRVNGPAWECSHCKQVEPVEWLEREAIMLSDAWFEQHGGRGKLQPDLPGLERASDLVVVHSL